MRNGRLLAGLIAAEGGNVMVLSAFSMLAIAGGAGIATDTIQWTLWQREMQRAADSAAMAAALVNAQGGNATTTAQTEVGRYNLASLTTAVEVGPTGYPQGVRVSLSTARRLAFSSLFMATAPTISASSTATVVSFGEYCVRSLETTTATGVSIGGNATVALGCGMHSNSQGNPAISAGGSSVVTASPISAVGAVPASANYGNGTVFQPYSLTQPDPYASLPTPVVPSPCNNRLNVGSGNGNGGGGNTQVSPGCYRGIDIQGRATFQPGTYIIDGDFDIGAQADVSGSGVTFILTSNNIVSNPSSVGNLKINGGAHLDLTAPTSGTYKGILIYQDRRASDAGGNANVINGSATSVLSGAIYMPAQEVNYTGTDGMTTTCLYLVARRVAFSGDNEIDNQCSSYGGDDFLLKGLQIRLVG